ncbi:DNA repair and recombination protein RadB [Candidatus Woesearchaeota archaeon]|nr:DNA repair and recombination protein RadB [Candidatus Woesearchaeota archaeon]
MARISSGSKVFDTLLKGGYETDAITTIFGPAGAGKTTTCILAAVQASKDGKKVIYVDTEGGFSLERFNQVASDTNGILNNIIFLRPATFEEQQRDFEKLRDLIRPPVGLVIIDTIAMLYRLEMGARIDPAEVNRDLAKQIAFLTEIARKKEIPVLITNQGYSFFDDRDKTHMVGGDVMRYGSKCIIELQIAPDRKRRAILRKHRSIAEGTESLFEIKAFGFVDVKDSKFRLF